MPTAHAECTFVVKEGGADRPFIVVEPTVSGVDIAFTITKDMTIQDAHELAEHMRRGIDSILLSMPSPRRQRSRKA
jgi:hypothetical protein